MRAFEEQRPSILGPQQRRERLLQARQLRELHVKRLRLETQVARHGDQNCGGGFAVIDEESPAQLDDARVDAQTHGKLNQRRQRSQAHPGAAIFRD